MLERIRKSAARFAAERGVTVHVEEINADPPTTCDDAIIAAIEASATRGRPGFASE